MTRTDNVIRADFTKVRNGDDTPPTEPQAAAVIPMRRKPVLAFNEYTGRMLAA